MKKIELEEFEKRLKEKFPNDNFLVIHYESLGKPLKIQCQKCGKVFEVNKASNFLSKTKVNGCSNCSEATKKRLKKLKEIEDKYTIEKTQVKETHVYYTIKCKKCGHIRTSTLKNLHKHLQCGCETGVLKNRTAEEFIAEVNKNSPEGTYTLIGEYKNQTTKVLLRHSCGFIWSVRPSDVIKGRSFCPKCGAFESKGTRFINKILLDNNIVFEREVKLEDSLLRFDFYFELDGNKKAIEYNGKQHYEEIPFFSTSLEQQQDRDERKRQYCKNNQIQLLEIPYWNNNEQITQAVLNFISSTTILKRSIL